MEQLKKNGKSWYTMPGLFNFYDVVTDMVLILVNIPFSELFTIKHIFTNF